MAKAPDKAQHRPVHPGKISRQPTGDTPGKAIWQAPGARPGDQDKALPTAASQ
jgi:hypothetical protein